MLKSLADFVFYSNQKGLFSFLVRKKSPEDIWMYVEKTSVSCKPARL